tara:strand:+ start:1335 stop:2522 length:1188 start_codon:yes stop_codon:yes gene_type:complete
MATQTPTTQELSATIVGQIEAQIGQTVPLLPKAFIRVLAKVLAAVFITLYKYIGFIGLQLFVRTASGSATVINGKTITPLIEWGRLIGLGDPLKATAAELTIDVTVENQTGSLPSGSQLLGAINGVTYLTIGAVLLDAPVVSVTVRAAADPNGSGGVGTIGNLDPGAILNFANPLPNVARETVVTAQTVTGADAETIDSYRQRVIDRFQRRPQGGAYADYAIWGEEVAGIANVYPYTGQPGEVDVYVESATETDGIPTQAQLDAVFNSIELDQSGLASRRPANAFVNVLPIVRTGFDVEVSGLTGNDLATLQADITGAVEGYFLQAEPFIVGLNTPPRKDRISGIELLGVINDIVKAADGTFNNATFSLEGQPSNITTYTLGEGEKAKASSVVFV